MELFLSDLSARCRYTYDMTASDQELLARYAQEKSEDAFAELVHRHVDLVYSAALRQVRSPQLAEEVAQSVFLDLSRQASNLRPGTVLTPWLYQVTRRTAIDVVRRESRRQLREQLALESADMNSDSTTWAHIEPLLEEAMQDLDETDRSALLLRYFENKSLREVGQVLGTSEDAAQKRVSRAVDRLRECFSRQGLKVGGTALVALLTANAVQSAPVGLGASISSAVITAGAAAPAATALGLTKAIVMTTTQKAVLFGMLTVAAGAGLYGARQAAHWRSQLASLQQQQAPLQSQLDQLRAEREAALAKLEALRQENDQLRSDAKEVPKLRGEVARLSAASRELNQFRTSGTNEATESAMLAWLTRVNQLKERLAQSPEAQIPELRLLKQEDWLSAAQGSLETEKDYRQALSRLRDIAETKVAQQFRSALDAYGKANAHQSPTDLSQLQPYLQPTLDPDILQRWQVASANTVSNVHMGGDWIITQKAPVDQEFDMLFVVGPNGYGSTSFKSLATTQEMQPDVNILKPALQAYKAANGDKEPADPSQIVPYLTTPEQQAAFQRMQDRIAKQKGQ